MKKCKRRFIVTYSNKNGKLYEGNDFKPREVMVLITGEDCMSDAEYFANEVMLDMKFNIHDHWEIIRTTEVF